MEKTKKLENGKNEIYEELRVLSIENPMGYTRAIHIDGGEIKLSKNSLHGRYVVAFTNYKLADFRNKTVSDILHEIYNFIKANPTLNAADFTVGGWRDANGQYFTDLGVAVNDLSVALEIAKKFNQKAVFDLQELKEIFV